MKSATWLRTASAVACIALVPGPWSHGASICNESCAPGRALSLQVLTLALPASLLLTAFSASASRPSPRRCLASGALAATLLLAELYLSFGR